MKTVLDLIELIYASVAGASRWQTFLDAFVLAVGGRTGALALHDANRDGGGVVCWSGWPDDEVRLYLDRYAAIDPWNINSGRWPEGLVGTDLDLCPREEIEPSAAFQEFYGPRDYFHGMGGTILVTGTGRSLITATRGAGAGPFGEPEQPILRALMPHLRQAAILHGEWGLVRARLDTFTGHLDRYRHAFLLIDAERRVLYSNDAARELTDARDGLAIEAGRILLRSPKEDAEFRAAARTIASARDASTMHRVEVSRPSGRNPFRLVLMPAHASGGVPLGVSQPTITVLIADSESEAEPDQSLLRELFSLTRAEARIAGKLALGRSVEEIATEAGTSVATVRTHVKRIMAKTGTERQGQLISLVLRSVPVRRP
jgi:DNA-binding CsgD family transcriptional regulator